MDKKEETKEIERLKKAKLRTYTLETFKRYWTNEDDYKSKKARVVNATFIVIYSLWHKRLLARTFYFEEYMKYKKITRQLFEVQRQVAGMSVKISQRIYNGTGVGLKIWTGIDSNGWIISNATSFQLYGIYSNWTGAMIIDYFYYNNPFQYLNKSIHKYSALELLPEQKKRHNEMFNYLLKYEKHPQIEMLVKLGLEHLVNNLTGIRWSKKGLAMLGINKDELVYLQGMTLQHYRKIRDWCVKYKFTVKEADVALKIYNVTNSKHNYERKENIVFTLRLVRYLSDKEVTINDYDDMIKAKKDLGLPDESKYLYPSDFKAMHDELIAKVEIKKSEILTKKIRAREKELKKLAIENQGFIIVPLLSQDELISEGKQMHHCVGGYAEKVAKGRTAIYSIRKSDARDKPIATLELRDKKVIQVRAEHNGTPSEDVNIFVRKWEKQFRLTGY